MEQLAQLAPAVAVVIVMAFFETKRTHAQIKARKEADELAAEMHKEKTIAFMKQSTEQRDAFMTELKEIRGENRTDREELRQTISANTETMKNVLSVLKKR